MPRGARPQSLATKAKSQDSAYLRHPTARLFSLITHSDSFLVVSLSDDDEILRNTNGDMAESTRSVCTAGRGDVLKPAYSPCQLIMSPD